MPEFLSGILASAMNIRLLWTTGVEVEAEPEAGGAATAGAAVAASRAAADTKNGATAQNAKIVLLLRNPDNTAAYPI